MKTVEARKGLFFWFGGYDNWIMGYIGSLVNGADAESALSITLAVVRPQRMMWFVFMTIILLVL
jgi:hypothetical protein